MSNQPIRVDNIEPEEVDWLWRERIPRKMLTVIAGRPDQGKGLLASHIAAEVTQAGGNVLISAWEDSDALVVRPRIEVAGARMDRCHSWRFVLPGQFAELAQTMIDYDIDLLIMDPWSAHMHGMGDIRPLLNPLISLIEQTGAAVIIIDHVLKKVPAQGGILAALRGGSSGLPAACRMAFVFGVDPEQPDLRVLCHIKGNIRDKAKPLRFELDTDTVAVFDTLRGKLVDKPFPYLVFDEEIEVFDPMRMFKDTPAQQGPGRPDTKRKAAAEWLTAYLAAAGKPVKAGLLIEDAKQAGMAVKTLKNAANEIGVVRNPPGGGKNCTWRLSDEALELMGVEQVDDEAPDEAPADDDIDDVQVHITDEDLQALLDGTDEEEGE